MLDGPDSFFGRLLVGESPVTPERVRARLYNSILLCDKRPLLSYYESVSIPRMRRHL